MKLRIAFDLDSDHLLTTADHLEGDGHFMNWADTKWAAQWLRGIVTKGEPT